MSKFKFKETGKEVKIGEKLVKVIYVFGIPVPIDEIIINEETLPKLIKSGLIVEEVENTNPDIQKAIIHLAERIGWNMNNLDKYLNNLYRISPAAVFSILLREVAIMIDKKYPNHINNSKEIWGISLLDGELKQVKDVHKIKNFRNFAAFRSFEDALIAKKVMSPILKDLYGKQKD